VMGSDAPETDPDRRRPWKGQSSPLRCSRAFTPTCSDYHLPRFRNPRQRTCGQREFDTIACLSVNDPFSWMPGGTTRKWVTRSSCSPTATPHSRGAMGLEFDGSTHGLGTRSRRYAAVIDDGVVTNLLVEPAGGLTVSSAESVLDVL